MSAAGENNYPGERDENPMVYKRVDSRLAFSGGFYKHVLQCPQGYKATGGGFDFNARNDDPTGEGYWSIVANFPADEGKNWVVEAHRSPKSSDKTFTAYALCAPEELLPGVVYEYDSRSLEARATEELWTTCKGDSRVIGGGFDFRGNQYMRLVHTERGADARSWGVGVKNAPPSMLGAT